MIMPNEIMLKR